jgi:pimeloyl-ACP methyl ester carboxylesterase
MKAPLLFALALAACTPAFAADAPQQSNRFAATIAPAERFEVGPLLVERHGQHGSALVLIPGMASGAWVWQDLVRTLSADHVLYVVTLPGFDGRPAIEGDAVQATRKALADLITTRRLDKPVLVGHSLGGTLALALAEDMPGAVGGVVSIDGLPVMPGSEDTPPDQRELAAAAMKASVVAADPKAYAAQQEIYFRETGVLDMAKAADLARLAARSDPAAVARYTADALALDLRPGLAKITAPVLVVAPYFAPDAMQDELTESQKVDYYKSLMAGTPKFDVVTLSPARHFAMIDQPQRIAETVRRFLECGLCQGQPK